MDIEDKFKIHASDPMWLPMKMAIRLQINGEMRKECDNQGNYFMVHGQTFIGPSFKDYHIG